MIIRNLMGLGDQGWTCLIFFSIHGYLNNIYYEELIDQYIV